MPCVYLLTGPKHCGKTAVTAALKHLLDCRAGDLDTIIAARYGKTPRELFIEGPKVFKSAETKILSFVLDKEETGNKSNPLVLAAGGGIIDNEEALSVVRGRPYITTIYLAVSAERAWQRIEETARKDGVLPPFLADSADPAVSHNALHRRRSTAYAAFAALTVDTEDKIPSAIASEIIEKTALKRYRRPVL